MQNLAWAAMVAPSHGRRVNYTSPIKLHRPMATVLVVIVQAFRRGVVGFHSLGARNATAIAALYTRERGRTGAQTRCDGAAATRFLF